MKSKAEASVICEPGGILNAMKMLLFCENWIAEGRTVDHVEISAEAKSAAMSAVVDGMVVTVEVPG